MTHSARRLHVAPRLTITAQSIRTSPHESLHTRRVEGTLTTLVVVLVVGILLGVLAFRGATDIGNWLGHRLHAVATAAR